MSKIKTPREKKLASLALDRRNAYGENDKASRKAIPNRKQMSHQAQRRSAKQPLLSVGTVAAEDELISIELSVLDKEVRGKRKAFKKQPDASLAEVLAYQRTGKWTPTY